MPRSASTRITTKLSHHERFLDKKEGMLAALVRKVLPNDALLAAHNHDQLAVDDPHFDEAMGSRDDIWT